MLCPLNYKRVEKPLPWDEVLVEIGFGRGDFLLRIASDNPDVIVLGFELSGIGIEKLQKRVKSAGIKNISCVRLDAYWGFHLLLKDNSIRSIYINYPDPWFKRRDTKRRLTSREKLFLFSKKLKEGGSLYVRTDHLPFAEFTIEEATWLGGFEYELRELETSEPLTKYEAKWLSQGKRLYQLTLVKVGETKPIELPKLKEVKELFPVKIEGKEPHTEGLEGKEFKLEEGVYLRLFRAYRRPDSELIEALLSEEGFTQRFFIELRKKGRTWIVDISPHSEVLRTENIQKAVNRVAEAAFRP